jgi:hypothetical protein
VAGSQVAACPAIKRSTLRRAAHRVKGNTRGAGRAFGLVRRRESGSRIHNRIIGWPRPHGGLAPPGRRRCARFEKQSKKIKRCEGAELLRHCESPGAEG